MPLFPQPAEILIASDGFWGVGTDEGSRDAADKFEFNSFTKSLQAFSLE